MYAIAGTTACAQFFGIKAQLAYLMAPFVIILALIVIIGHSHIAQTISVLTVVKSSLLILMVFIAAILGSQIGLIPKDYWGAVLKPLLVTTVTLGGIINVFPVIYSKFKPTRRNIMIFMTSVIAGIVVCGLVVIGWTYAVLKIVPQRGAKPTDPSLSKYDAVILFVY